MPLLGPEHHQPFPDIARYPREPKLADVPRSGKESVFSDKGTVDALDILAPLYDANSDDFRRTTRQLLGERTVRQLGRIQEGLSLVAGQSDERRGRRIGATASRVLERVEESITSRQVSVEKEVDDHSLLPDYMLMSDDWRELAPDYPCRDLPIPKTLDKWDRDVALRSAVLPLANADFADPRLAPTGYYMYRRFIEQFDSRDPDNAGAKLDASVAFGLVRATSNLLYQPGEDHPSAGIRHRIDCGIMYGLMERLDTYDIDTVRHTLDYVKTTYADPTTGELPISIQDRLAVLEIGLINRMQIEWYANQYTSKAARLATTVLRIDESFNEEMSDELMREVLKLRRYGIKSAIVDGTTVLARQGEQWVVREPLSEEVDGEAIDRRFDPMVAYFDLASEVDIKGTGMGPSESVELHGMQFTGRKTPYATKVSFGISASGELMSATSLGVLTPVKHYFERADAEHIYQALRLYFVNIVHDLVVPDSVSVITQPKTPEKPGFLGFLNRVKNDPFRTILDISLPRVRYIQENEESIINELEEAAAARDETVSQDERRMVRMHDVVWFVRTLPRGYSATPQARQMAARAGVQLGEGETFVRAHQRGNKVAGAIAGHIAKR